MSFLLESSSGFRPVIGGVSAAGPSSLHPATGPSVSVEQVPPLLYQQMTMCELFRSTIQHVSEMLVILPDPDKIQVCFLVDATGSMQSHIDAVKKTIKAVAEEIRTKLQGQKLELAFVAYRDFEDGEPETFGFTTSPDQFAERLAAVKATGGGDWAEDIFSGMQAVLKFPWDARSRVLIHIADAPNHGKVYHGSESGDSKTDFDSDLALGKQLVKNLLQKGLDWNFLKINNDTDKMIEVFASLYNPVAPRPLEQFNLGSSDVATDVRNAVVSSIMSSCVGTRARLRGKIRVAPAPTRLLRSIDWSGDGKVPGQWSPMQQVTLLSLPSFNSLQNFFRKIKGDLEAVDCRDIYVSTVPLGYGSTRECFYVKDDDHPEKKFVGKILRHQKCDPQLVRDLVLGDHRSLKAAQFLASLFNARSSHKVGFVSSQLCLAEVRGKTEWMSIEPFLEGEFKKFNNNAGYANHSEPVAQAFSHYTFQASGGMVVVTDLQGSDITHMTDPALHCNAPKGVADGPALFGVTNLGHRGIGDFMKAHRCNDLCKQMGLEDVKEARDPPMDRVEEEK